MLTDFCRPVQARPAAGLPATIALVRAAAPRGRSPMPA